MGNLCSSPCSSPCSTPCSSPCSSPQPHSSSSSSPNDLPLDGKYEKYVPGVSVGRVVKVYDGDTITVIGRVPHNPTIYKFSVRLYGIDCPEMRTHNECEKKIALKAKEYVSQRVSGHLVTLKETSLDKYGRLLAKVFCQDGGCVNDELVREHLAVEYDGGTKKIPDNWEEYYNNK